MGKAGEEAVVAFERERLIEVKTTQGPSLFRLKPPQEQNVALEAETFRASFG